MEQFIPVLLAKVWGGNSFQKGAGGGAKIEKSLLPRQKVCEKERKKIMSGE